MLEKEKEGFGMETQSQCSQHLGRMFCSLEMYSTLSREEHFKIRGLAKCNAVFNYLISGHLN